MWGRCLVPFVSIKSSSGLVRTACWQEAAHIVLGAAACQYRTAAKSMLSAQPLNQYYWNWNQFWHHPDQQNSSQRCLASGWLTCQSKVVFCDRLNLTFSVWSQLGDSRRRAQHWLASEHWHSESTRTSTLSTWQTRALVLDRCFRNRPQSPFKPIKLNLCPWVPRGNSFYFADALYMQDVL